MKTLTIAIPTYNRAIFLKRCLDSINKEIIKREDVEVVIYDNNSTDQTFEIATEFAKINSHIKYVKNDTNIGPDKNIGQSYYNSNSRYTLVFGDDDLLLSGSLLYILNILNSPKEFGLIFLNYYSFKEDYIKEKPLINSNDVLKLGLDDMIRITGFRLGFISACIVNSKSIYKDEILANVGTNFNHLYPIIGSLKLGFDNLYINKFTIAQQEANSGGFDYFKVFAMNYVAVFEEILGKSHHSIQILRKELFLEILPTAILFSRLKLSPKCYQLESAIEIASYFHKSILFKVCNLPILKLPIILARVYNIGIKVMAKLYRRLIILRLGLTANKYN